MAHHYDRHGKRHEVARFPRVCAYCNDVITVGEQYTRRLKTDDSVRWVWNIHDTCDYVSNALIEYADSLGYAHCSEVERFYPVLSDFVSRFGCENCPFKDEDGIGIKCGESYSCVKRALGILSTKRPVERDGLWELEDF